MWILFFLIAYSHCATTGELLQLFSSPRNYQILSYQPGRRSDGKLVTISVNGFPQIRQSYIPQLEKSVSSFSFRVGNLRIVEIIKDNSVETTTSKCEFNGLGGLWQPFNRTDVSKDANIQVINYSTTFFGVDECAGLEVDFDVFLTNNDTMLSAMPGTTQVPFKFDEPKYVLKIRNYPYKLDESKLAVAVAIFSEKARDFDQNSISTLQNQVGSGNLDYNPVAVADNELVSVLVSELKEPDGTGVANGDDGDNSKESYNIIYFTFDKIQPKSLMWDPTLSIDLGSAMQSNSSALGFSLPLLSLVVFSKLLQSLLQ